MKTNVGKLDRAIRIVIGIFLLSLGVSGYIGIVRIASIIPQALSSVILISIGIVSIVTGVKRFCPAYSLLNVNTREE